MPDAGKMSAFEAHYRSLLPHFEAINARSQPDLTKLQNRFLARDGKLLEKSRSTGQTERFGLIPLESYGLYYGITVALFQARVSRLPLNAGRNYF